MASFHSLVMANLNLFLAETFGQLDLSHLISKDSRRLYEALTQFVPQASIPRGPNGERTILNVACGPCPEALAYHAFAGEVPLGKMNPKVTHLGIDIKITEIARARGAHTNLPNFRFEACAAASMVAKFPEYFPADMAFIRHHYAVSNANTWFELFRETADAVKEGAPLVITSLSLPEHAVARRFLELHDVNITFEGPNPHRRLLRAAIDGRPDYYCDGFIIVAEGRHP